MLGLILLLNFFYSTLTPLIGAHSDPALTSLGFDLGNYALCTFCTLCIIVPARSAMLSANFLTVTISLAILTSKVCALIIREGLLYV